MEFERDRPPVEFRSTSDCRSYGLLRAGLPADWSVGDKTGAGERGSTNDIAVIWPAGRKPVLVTAYLTGTAVFVEQRNAPLASVGRAVAVVLEA